MPGSIKRYFYCLIRGKLSEANILQRVSGVIADLSIGVFAGTHP